MPNAIQLPPIRRAAGEEFTGALILDGDLPAGVTISSATVSATGVTIADQAPTEGTYTHQGVTYAIARVLTYTVSGGTTGTDGFAVFTVTYSNGWDRIWSQPFIHPDPTEAL